ncbi:prolipoprotein diacylglyceryl transferase family protein [Streptomyces sp. NPDC001034]|uniref:prolipoprotein diacylglyceryl transferase n=1 Tax=Streptomyces sp. NPDC001034 TaxID=3154375 RepID=UPI0033195F46
MPPEVIRALHIWDGGPGIPGAVALGAVGTRLDCRRRGIKLADFADPVAPGLVPAQAVGRWGNYFNQELYGRPAHLPWALQIDPGHRPADMSTLGLYHPTFLYGSLWDLGVMALLLWLDRHHHSRLRRGRLFACYMLAYIADRGWIQALRIDHANHFLGPHRNDYVSLILSSSALLYPPTALARTTTRRIRRFREGQRSRRGHRTDARPPGLPTASAPCPSRPGRGHS